MEIDTKIDTTGHAHAGTLSAAPAAALSADNGRALGYCEVVVATKTGLASRRGSHHCVQVHVANIAQDVQANVQCGGYILFALHREMSRHEIASSADQYQKQIHKAPFGGCKLRGVEHLICE